MESNTTEASRLALSYAMDLAERAQGQPWGADPIVAAAQKFQEFLQGGDLQADWVLDLLEQRDQRIQALEDRLADLEVSPTPPPSKRAATNTTPPEPDALDVPEPVDF